MKSALNVVYEWNVEPNAVHDIVEGVDPALYTDIHLTIVMGGVRLIRPYLTPEGCYKLIDEFHEKYKNRMGCRH